MSDAASFKQQGNACVKAGKYSDAIVEYTKAIEANEADSTASPDHTVYANRSVAHYHLESYEDALKDGTSCVDICPTWPKGYLRKGNAQVALGFVEEGRHTYAAGLQHEPENASLMRALREATQQTTEESNPMSGITELFQNPGLLASVKNHPSMAAFKDSDELDEAIEDIKENPDHIGEHFQKPVFMQFLQTLMQTMSPGENSQPPAGFGSEAGSYEEPVVEEAVPEPEPELSEEEIAENEKKAVAAAIKAEADKLFKAKNYEGAIAKYTEGMEVYDKEIRFVLNRAACHMSLKKFEKCIADCDIAFTRGKEIYADYTLMARAKGRKGDALSKLGLFEEAVTAYKASLTETRDPKILKKLRATQKLNEDLKQKNYQDPEKAAAAKELGNVAFRNGETPAAVEHYSEAIKRDPTQVAYYCNRAAAYTKLLAIPQSIADCDRAISLDPTYHKAYTRKAAAYMKGEEYHSATRVFKALLKVVPDSEQAEAGIMRVRMAVSEIRAEGGERAQRVAERALRDKEIAAIYQSPQVQAALVEAQRNPSSLQRLMAKDEFINDSIQTLMAAGVV